MACFQAVLDPYVNAVHVSMLRERRPSEESRDYFLQLRMRLLREGPAGFSTKKKWRSSSMRNP